MELISRFLIDLITDNNNRACRQAPHNQNINPQNSLHHFKNDYKPYSSFGILNPMHFRMFLYLYYSPTTQ